MLNYYDWNLKKDEVLCMNRPRPVHKSRSKL